MPWLQAASAFAQWQQQALQQMTSMWSGAMPFGAARCPAPTAPADRRFAGDAWRNDPRFDGLTRAYLGQSELLHKTLAAAPLDDRSKAQWGFVLRQVVDALSPANSLATNPEAMQTALETGGASLVEGMRLFMQDFAKGRVSMTDDTAFEVGRNVATSPGSVVFENELMQLIQYTPSTAKVHTRPLVIVPPCINKFYILDLQPENSFVGYAVAQGHTVFLVSWRNIGPEQGAMRWDDYLEQGVMQAIDTALAISRADRVNTLGFCVGGTLLASALAVMAAKKQDKVASMTLLTTMLDFTDTGELGLLVNEQSAAAREAQIGQGGLLKGSELAQVFAALRANDLIWPYVVAGYLKGKAPPAFDLLFWNGDDTNLPGPMFCWYLRNTYLENKLRVPGATTPVRRAGGPGQGQGSDVPLRLARGPHRALADGLHQHATAGRRHHLRARRQRPHRRCDQPAGQQEAQPLGRRRGRRCRRLAGAAPATKPGSWWPAWSGWLEGHAGALVPAPKTPGNRQFAVIEPAPGRYVKAKAP